MVSETIHICSFIEVNLPWGLLDPFSLDDIFNVDNVMISLAHQRHPLHPVHRGAWVPSSTTLREYTHVLRKAITEDDNDDENQYFAA